MKVINKYKENPPPNAIWIMRGYKYGNPFIIGKDGNRDEVCDKYVEYADEKFTDKEVIADLKGKVLVCCCKPKRCHGDYLSARFHYVISSIATKGE